MICVYVHFFVSRPLVRQTILAGRCPVQVSIAMLKHQDQKPLREGRVISAHNSLAHSVNPRTCRPELMQEAWRVLPTDVLLMACLACSLLALRTTRLEVALPIVSWALSPQTSISELFHRLAHRPIFPD